MEPLRRGADVEAWHAGVALLRRGEVFVEAVGPAGWSFFVAGAQATWAWGAWSCDCGATAACAHVVAAAAGLALAGGLLARLPALARAELHTGYRLRSDAAGLSLAVVAITVDARGEVDELRLAGRPRARDPVLAATPAGKTELRLADGHAALLAHLARALDVTLDGAPVRVDPAPLRGDASAATRRFAGTSLALCGDTLRPLEIVEVATAARVAAPASPHAAPPPGARIDAAPTGPTSRADASPPAAPAFAVDHDPEGDHEVPLARHELEPRWQDDAVTFTAGDAAVSVPAEQVVQAWRSGSRAVEAADGGLAWLPHAWLERYGAVLEQFVQARQEARGELPRWARPAAAALCASLDAPPPRALAGLAALARDFAGIPPAALPPDLTAELRDYQRRGVDWLCLLRDAGVGALLADDMGLGKTLQTACALAGRVLVVAPTSTLHNWAAELARFRPALRVHLYHGPRRALEPGDGVTLTSYALLRLDHEPLAAVAWDIVVLDEAQAIKEPTTATATAACALQAGWRVALSGTPVENRLTELWSLCHFLNPGLLGGRKDFVERFARPIEGGSPRAAAELQARLRPLVLRRRKSEVARELPPRTEVVLRVALDPNERLVYDSLRAATHAELIARLAAGGDMIEALELLLRLRQAACHPALIPGQQATRSSKVDLLLEQLGEVTAAGHRALVFSQWTSLLDLVEDALTTARLNYLRLDGRTEDRADVVARFQAADGPPVMLVSLRAGGTGLNLTAADHVYLLDPWWNPAVEDQAADRAHRIGQARPVFVHRLVAEGTVEEKILELHARKRALSIAALEGAQAQTLSREDLVELLR
jgi:superfamily II DNA or RNA helicase